MSFQSFIETAWTDHGDHPEAVADRLAQSLHVIAAPGDIPPYARLVTHVYGEHLARWQSGVELLASLRRLPVWDATPPLEAAVARNVAVLQLLRRHGDGAA